MSVVLCHVGWWLVLHYCELARLGRERRSVLVPVPEEARGRMLRRIRRRLTEAG